MIKNKQTKNFHLENETIWSIVIKLSQCLTP